VADCRVVLKTRFNPLATSQFTSYDFQSFAVMNGSLYGVNEDGLFLLEGADDAGVDILATIGFGLIDFGRRTMKRLRAIYFKAKTGGVDLSVETENGDVETYVVDATTFTTTVKRSINRSLKGRMFEIEISNIDGGAFDVREIDLIVSYLASRENP